MLGFNPALLNQPYFVEFRPASELYAFIFFYQSIALACTLIRMTYFLKMSSEFEIIFVTLEKTGKFIV